MSTTSPLLHTPTSEGYDAGNHRGQPDSLNQTIRYLPTPKSQEGGWKAEPHHRLNHRAYQEMRDGRIINRTWGVKQVLEVLTSSAEATPASPSATPASAAAPRTRATSGPSSPVSLASFDPDGCCWRTYQATLLSEEQPSLQSLPRWGMTRRGLLYALPISELRTDESDGSASLNVPTPTASDAVWAERDHSRRGIVGNHNLGLVDWVKVLPTPTQDDGSNVTRASGDYQSLVRSIGDITPPPSSDGSE